MSAKLAHRIKQLEKRVEELEQQLRPVKVAPVKKPKLKNASEFHA